MVAWRVAKSLLQLRDQWQAAYPGAANPGFIGDAEHASRTSDHNPWVDDPTSPVNVVTAGDFYHQPSIGADAYVLAEDLKAAKDPRVKYVISRRRIWSLARDREGWRPYGGANPHTGHTHVSVTSSYPLYDRSYPWDITTTEEDPEVTDEQMQELKDHQREMARIYAVANNNYTRQIVAASTKAILAKLETVDEAAAAAVEAQLQDEFALLSGQILADATAIASAK